MPYFGSWYNIHMTFRQARPLILALLGSILLFLPVVAFAQLPDKIVPCNGVDCSVCDIATLAQNVLNTGIYIAIFLSAVLFAWAGWQALTAGGSGEKISQAKSIFGNVLIGLIIILAGWLVVDTLMKTMTNGSFGPWNKVCKYAQVVSPFDHFYA